jgi:DNA-binding CsgD family transcriptional regulator
MSPGIGTLAPGPARGRPEGRRPAPDRRDVPRHPGPARETPDAATTQVLAALREALRLAEAGLLPLHAGVDQGLCALVEHDGVRCAISVDAVTASDGLSPRELEIARLVARGATNRMIASVLEISTWTVSTHLRRIFAKLGVASRAEMVATLLGR